MSGEGTFMQHAFHPIHRNVETTDYGRFGVLQRDPRHMRRRGTVRDVPSAGAFLERREDNDQKNHHEINHCADRAVRLDTGYRDTASCRNIRSLINWQTLVDFRQDIFTSQEFRVRQILRGNGCLEVYEQYGEYYQQVISWAYQLASNKRICIVSHSFVDFCLACK